MRTRGPGSWKLTRRDVLRGAAAFPAFRLLAQTGPDGFKAYTDAPRLFLTANRLKLLRRERDRKSLRWEQFELLWNGGAQFPEFGWTAALRYQIAQDESAGRQAVAWAVARSTVADNTISENIVRQIALIADWCEPLLAAADKAAVYPRLERAALKPATGVTIAEARTKTLAALAITEAKQASSEKALKDLYEGFWLKTFLPGIRAGKLHVTNAEAYALLELMHAFRDNLTFDLRENLSKWFKDYTLMHILAHYPEPWSAAENEFRIPADVQIDKRGPDVTKATLSRAAGLAMVAFDANAGETQLMQGFLMNDRFLMRGTLGIAYELLWANPYQPGLSYYHVPLVAHDSFGGQLFVRSTWEDNADWLGYFDGQVQLFANGEVVRVDPNTTHEPMDVQEATVFFAHGATKFRVPPRTAQPAPAGNDHTLDAGAAPADALDDVFIVGLEPGRRHHLEVDGEGMFEDVSDPGGIIYMPGLPAGANVRFAPVTAAAG